MRIFSKGALRSFWEDHQDARSALEFWYDTVEKTDFMSPNEVISFFNTADTVGSGRIVLNITGNKYCLVAKFVYEKKFALCVLLVRINNMIT